jgi:hypothetical protein
VPLGWRATPAFAAVVSYDVRYSRARWDGSFGSPVTWKSATTATSGTFPAATGSSYCFSVRARDADGGVSQWSGEACTAIPVDDRALTRSGTWAAGTGTAFYRGTWLRSYARGAKLTLSGAKGRRVALVASTCPTCGSVRVYWRDERATDSRTLLLGTVSLYSATRKNRVLIPVKTFVVAKKMTLTVKVASSGSKVVVDGLAVGRN